MGKAVMGDSFVIQSMCLGTMIQYHYFLLYCPVSVLTMSQGEDVKIKKSDSEEGRNEAVDQVAFDRSQTMVLLKDIPYWLDEERLELFLESKNCERCHVKSIDFHAEDGNAVVEFEYPEGKTL